MMSPKFMQLLEEVIVDANDMHESRRANWRWASEEEVKMLLLLIGRLAMLLHIAIREGNEHAPGQVWQQGSDRDEHQGGTSGRETL